jgi:hypothetical protein
MLSSEKHVQHSRSDETHAQHLRRLEPYFKKKLMTGHLILGARSIAGGLFSPIVFLILPPKKIRKLHEII